MADDRTETTTGGRPSRARSSIAHVAHFVGNVLLGLSLGLVSYYGITNLLSSAAQSALESELEELGPIALPEPPLADPAEAPADFETWAEEDLAYWNDLEPGDVFGRLVIPLMEADVIVVKGTDQRHLRRGPGWIVETDPPGPTGNAGISGHRTTWGAPFRRIEELEIGGEIRFYSPYRQYVYEVTEQLIVRPHQTEVVASTEEPMLTLTACHPPYSAAFRIVAQAQLAEVRRLEVESGD